MGAEEELATGVWKALRRRGVTRRDFLKFCAATTAALALPTRYVPRVVRALETTARPVVVWRQFQDCAGNSEALLRASHPTVGEIVLDLLSVNYHEFLMAPSGAAAEKSIADTIQQYRGEYLAVIEGSIPTGDGGAYCTIGGRSAIDLAREAVASAKATIAVGTCATFGGIPAAAGGPTGAVGVADAVRGSRVLNLSGCPANAANIAAVVVHYLTFDDLPATDDLGRPLFMNGELIHDHCPRRAHYDAGQFVQEWGDEGHRQGWCLYKMGCKGPSTSYNCPQVQYNEGTSWPIGVGHGCVGCAEPAFWDRMTPFYRTLSSVPGFGVETTAQQVGIGLVAGVGALTAAHAVGSNIRRRRAAGPKGQDAESGKDGAQEATTEERPNPEASQ
jgi:hydrogenase small subunit